MGLIKKDFELSNLFLFSLLFEIDCQQIRIENTQILVNLQKVNPNKDIFIY